MDSETWLNSEQGIMDGQLDGIDDSVLDDLDEEEDNDNDAPVSPENNMDNKDIGIPITVLNTNARSLCPKIDSLIDCFAEMDSMIGVVTETWLSDGDSLEKDIKDLALGAGLGMICLNRKPNDRGVSHGGVAVLHRVGACTLQRLDLLNAEGFEVLVTLSSIPGYSRKLLTVACYLPPQL